MLNSAVTSHSTKGIWISMAEVKQLPISGPTWRRLRAQADRPAGSPNIRNQDQMNNVFVLAKALVYARTGIPAYREEVIDQCMKAIGTEEGGQVLALARELPAYVVAADLVGLPAEENAVFRKWLRHRLIEELDGFTLRSIHETRPNNWGTHAGASRAAAAVYLEDKAEIERTAQVFKGWLGDRDAYAGFTFGNAAWQCEPNRPVGINRIGCFKDSHTIDGVLPDDQRRAGGFRWPPPKENYVYEALQGAVVQAEILRRAGYDTFQWSDQAILRAFKWLHQEAQFPAQGDDTWLLPIIDKNYGTNFSATLRAVHPGKNIGWTEWTHASRRTAPHQSLR